MLGVVNTDENHAPNIVTGDPFLEANELGDTDGAPCTPAQEANLTLARIKIATEAHKANTSSMPSLEATSPNYRPSEGDTGSVHSLPVAHVTETQSAQTRPSTALAHSLSGATPIASAAVARTQQSAIREATTIAGGERMNRHRSGVEVCSALIFDLSLWGLSLFLLVACIKSAVWFFLQLYSSKRWELCSSFSKWLTRGTDFSSPR